jgi:hypothetical protein
VVGDLPTSRPQACAGVPAQATPGDAHDAGDERLPVRIETAVDAEDLDPAVLLATMGVAIDRLAVIGREPG